MSVPANLYPFSTQDGKVIPLDIIRPSALVKLSPTASIAGPLAIDISYSIGVFMSDVDCLVRFGSTISLPLGAGTIYTNVLLVPANTLTVSVIPASPLYYATAGEVAGTLWIQLIAKWAGLGLEKQFVRK